MPRVLIATSNPGKLHDFAAAALPHGIEIASLSNFASLPEVNEDGDTFEANAQTIFDQAENRLHVQKSILNWLVS